MPDRFTRTVGRRRFLLESAGALSAFSLLHSAGLSAAEDRPNTHNMLVFGERSVFLSHLPMFDGVNGAKTAFTSPHRYQVILEAMFVGRDGKSIQDLYTKDRQAHGDERIYTLNPDNFVLSRVFAPEGGAAALATFDAHVFRGHLERGGETIRGLDPARVQIVRVVHGRQFDPKATKSKDLEYLVFGKGDELFAAHAITAPPDFDHVAAVKLEARTTSGDDLTGNLRFVATGRENIAASRLREGQSIDGTLVDSSTASATPVKARLTVTREIYFEEGELLVPPSFDDTTEEKKR